MPIKATTYPTHISLPRPNIVSPLRLIATAYSVWRERQHLSNLDDAALRDIGKSAKAAHSEAKRPFWDAPNRWTR